jgi:hypothetical protein
MSYALRGYFLLMYLISRGKIFAEGRKIKRPVSQLIENVTCFLTLIRREISAILIWYTAKWT